MKPVPNAIPEKWTWHHRALLRLRTDLLAARGEHERAARLVHERGGADAIDFADDEVELTTLRAELALENTELAEIEAALGRLQHGSYGLCEVTGKPIAAERLKALPWTRFSKEAAARIEQANGSKRGR